MDKELVEINQKTKWKIHDKVIAINDIARGIGEIISIRDEFIKIYFESKQDTWVYERHERYNEMDDDGDGIAKLIPNKKGKLSVLIDNSLFRC